MEIVQLWVQMLNTDDKLTLGQAMDGCQQVTSHYLHQCCFSIWDDYAPMS